MVLKSFENDTKKKQKKKSANENMDWLGCQELLIRCSNFDFTIWFRASLVTGTFEKQAPNGGLMGYSKRLCK